MLTIVQNKKAISLFCGMKFIMVDHTNKFANFRFEGIESSDKEQSVIIRNIDDHKKLSVNEEWFKDNIIIPI